jgi:hypothetical protein
MHMLDKTATAIIVIVSSLLLSATSFSSKSVLLEDSSVDNCKSVWVVEPVDLLVPFGIASEGDVVFGVPKDELKLFEVLVLAEII